MAKAKDNSLNGVAKLAEKRRLAEGIQSVCDPEFEARWPSLFSLLMNPRCEDGKVVASPVLSFSNSNGDWKVTLSIAGLRMYGKRLFNSFLGGLDALEREILEDSFPWEYDLTKRIEMRTLGGKKQ